MSEKLQKVLARAGLGSRREIETWIEEGRLVVNGYPALLGTRVEPKDEVKLDGRRLKLIPESLVNRKILMYHKPEGEVTTRKDPEGRATVFDRLPPMRGSRWVAIGRLDLNTSGLLLFTNDGEVANRLMHPSHEVEREYAVRILGELKPAQRKKLLEGVVLEDGLARFNSIESRGGGGSNRWYHVTLSEGRTREVRRMFESMDLVVSRLIRVRYGPVALDPLLKQGMNRELNLEETNRLCEAVGIEPQAPRAERRREYQQTRRSESVTGSGATDDYGFDDEGNAPRASARKPKVIGSKDDDLPLDRVERAAELLRRRRAAESAGVEFSGRNRRLSGKRTLRESELRRIAEEKAAAKKLEGAASSTGLKRSAAVGKTRSTAASLADDEAPRRTRSAAGSRSSSADKPASRSRAGVGASSRADARDSVRAAPARPRTRVGREDDEVPRRSARPAVRSTRASEDEAPRRRSSTSRPAGASSDRPVRSRSSASTGERSSSSRTADSRATDSRKSASSAKPASRSGAAPRASASRSAAKPAGRSAAAKPASRSSAEKPASRSSAAKPASRSTAAKPARSGARPAAPSRAGSGGKSAGTSRGGAGSSGTSRSGTGRSGSSAGKGKRTR